VDKVPEPTLINYSGPPIVKVSVVLALTLIMHGPKGGEYKGSGILGNLFKVQGTITCNTRYPIVPTW
jgi:hypothetical protein